VEDLQKQGIAGFSYGARGPRSPYKMNLSSNVFANLDNKEKLEKHMWNSPFLCVQNPIQSANKGTATVDGAT
jgi:hypothetical protein